MSERSNPEISTSKMKRMNGTYEIKTAGPMGRPQTRTIDYLLLVDTVVDLVVAAVSQPMLLIVTVLIAMARANVITFFISNSLW